MSVPVNAKPGDFFLVKISGEGGKVIRSLQGLNGDGFEDFEHVALYVGQNRLIEMASGGIQAASFSKYSNVTTAWSSGIINTQGKGPDIVGAGQYYLMSHIGYAWEDYAALSMHHFHIPVPGLKAYMASHHHMICSQFIDQCYQDAGVHLFDDLRWPGYVTPGDLYQLLKGHQDNEA